MSVVFGLFKQKNGGRYIKRIDTNSNLSKFIEDEFLVQERQFFYLGDERLVEKEFLPTWPTAKEGEVLFIKEFDDAYGFTRAIKSPIDFEQFSPESEMSQLIGVFTTIKEKPNDILFQYIDYRHVLLRTKRWWMVHKMEDSNTFIQNCTDGLLLDNKLTAVYRDRKLYFHNFTLASRLLNLNLYLQEANTEVVVEFLAHDSISTPNNPQDFAERLSSTHKKLVTAVMAYGCLERLTPQDIQRRASRSKSGIAIDLSDKGKIIIPEDSDRRAQVLQFMANIIVPSYLDDETDYEVNGSRPYDSN